MDCCKHYINIKDTQELLSKFSTVHFLQPRPIIENSKKRKRPCLDLLKQLINLQADVSSLINVQPNPTETAPAPMPKKKEVKEETPDLEIKAEFVPNFSINVNNDVIVVEDDSDEEGPTRTPPPDSGIGSCDHSEADHDWANQRKDAIYAEPIPTSKLNLEDNFIEEFWEPPEIRVNETYLVPMRDKWVQARLTEKLSKKRFLLVELEGRRTVEVGWESLAQTRPVDNLLRVGSRVVAGLRGFKETGELVKGKGKLKLGVVAEPPNGNNGSRYLIIFDSGYWLYVPPKHVNPIFHTPNRVWKLVPERNRKVVKRFLKGKFGPVKSVMKGQMVEVHNDGNTAIVAAPGLHLCQALSVDASLVLIWYYSCKRAEWIYAGSPRLIVRSMTC